MLVIMDERHCNHRKITNGELVVDIDRRIMQMAEFVVVVKDDSYQVLKDRYTGETDEYPIDELPELIKQRLVLALKTRDQIDTREDDD